MQIQPISNVSFEKKRYLSKQQLNGIMEITEKMNNAGKYSEKGLGFTSEVVGGLKYRGATFLSSLVCYLPHVAKNKLNQMTTEFSMGKNRIKINNSDGEILHIKTTLFKSQKRFMEELDKYLQIFNEKFNESIVEKRLIRLKGLTAEGAEYLARIANEDKR